MKVLVCGGRDFTDSGWLFRTLDALHAQTPITLIVHGGAWGADNLAEHWALMRRVRYVVYCAKWKKYGPAAGPLRNQQMLDEEHPDLVVAFPGNAGTADMIARAHEAGVKVIQP